MRYVVSAHYSNRSAVHTAKNEEAALAMMDRLYEQDVRYDAVDEYGISVDENDLTDRIDARDKLKN